MPPNVPPKMRDARVSSCTGRFSRSGRAAGQVQHQQPAQDFIIGHRGRPLAPAVRRRDGGIQRRAGLRQPDRSLVVEVCCSLLRSPSAQDSSPSNSPKTRLPTTSYRPPPATLIANEEGINGAHSSIRWA